MNGRRLTFWEATGLMVGAGVGAGIMAVPYLAQRVGLLPLVGILVVAYAATCLIHLLLAEVLFRTQQPLQVVELMQRYVFQGRLKWLLWAVFALLTVAFVAILAAYVSGAGEIVTDLTGLSPPAAQLLVYLVSAGVVFFGLKAVGVFEQWGAALLIGFVLVLAIGAAGVPFEIQAATGGEWGDGLILYAMVMYAIFTFYTVPQVTKGLAPDRGAAVRAVILGLGLNTLITAVVAFIALGVSRPVTELAITGIADAVGGWAGTVGSLFILVALVTSYWSVSLALSDILAERTGMNHRMSWLLATLPSILVLYLGAWQFIEWLRLAGGATGIVVVLISIPMYLNARRHGDAEPGWTLGRWGTAPLLALVVLAAVLMAIGSLMQL